MCLLIAYLPSAFLDSTVHIFILSFGVIGLWRYGVWFTHYARCILYRRVVFPKLRRAADEVDACGFKAGHVYVLCTSYRTAPRRSEEHTSELQSLMRISYAVFCLKKKK